MNNATIRGAIDERRKLQIFFLGWIAVFNLMFWGVVALPFFYN